MTFLKATVLASAFLAGGALAAYAQTPGTGSSAAGANTISAATHCKDSTGKVQLKSAMSGSGSGAAASTTGTTGSKATENNSVNASGSGSSSVAGATAGSAGSTADLPNC